MIAPAEGAITSGFGVRTHPVTGEKDVHKGLDYAGENGSPVLAAADGIVLDIGYQPDTEHGYGNYIILGHDKLGWSGLTTRYGHLKEKPEVEMKQNVKQGQVLGRMGNTGAVAPKPTIEKPNSGTHLHFEVRWDNKPQNPLDYMKGR